MSSQGDTPVTSTTTDEPLSVEVNSELPVKSSHEPETGIEYRSLFKGYSEAKEPVHEEGSVPPGTENDEPEASNSTEGKVSGDPEFLEELLSPRTDSSEDQPTEAPEPEEPEVKLDLLKRKRKEHTLNELLVLNRRRIQQENRIWSLYSNLLGVDKRAFLCLIQNPLLDLPSTSTEAKTADESAEGGDAVEGEIVGTMTSRSATASPRIPRANPPVEYIPPPVIPKTKKARMIEVAKNYLLQSVQIRSYKETEVQGLTQQEKLEMFREEIDMYEQMRSYHETNQQKVLEGQQKVEELAAEVKKLEVEEQRSLLNCLVYEKQNEEIHNKAFAFMLTTQNISTDLFNALRDAKKLEHKMDERLEMAYQLLLLHQPLYELHEINQTEMTEYHKLMNQNIQRRQKTSVPLDEPAKDVRIPSDFLKLLDICPEEANYVPPKAKTTTMTTTMTTTTTTTSKTSKASTPSTPATPSTSYHQPDSVTRTPSSPAMPSTSSGFSTPIKGKKEEDSERSSTKKDKRMSREEDSAQKKRSSKDEDTKKKSRRSKLFAFDGSTTESTTIAEGDEATGQVDTEKKK